MVWTKLLHTNIASAIKPSVVDGKWYRPVISARYKATLKKEFRLAGVPWIYESNALSLNNPRDKKPKGHKHEFRKPIHLAKVKKSLEDAEEAMEKYRKERLNGRRLSGMDLLIKNTVPSFMNARGKHLEQAEMDTSDDGVKAFLGIRDPKKRR